MSEPKPSLLEERGVELEVRISQIQRALKNAIGKGRINDLQSQLHRKEDELKYLGKIKITRDVVALFIDNKPYDVEQYTIDDKLQNKVNILDKELSVKNNRIEIVARFVMDDNLTYLSSVNFATILGMCKTWDELMRVMNSNFTLYWSKDD